MTNSLQSDLLELENPRLLVRQRRLLGLLGALGGRVQATDFQKLLFLYCQEQLEQGLAPAGASTYDFVPYRNGAFSFTCYADRRRLIDKKLLVEDQRSWALSAKGEKVAAAVSGPWTRDFVSKYRGIRGDRLIAETYRRYPYYASRSEIARRVLGMDREALQRIKSAAPSGSVPRLLTIGYEGRTIETYLNLLLGAGVTVLCDVRKNAVSRKYGFSKTTLRRACEGVGIRYEHAPDLGIPSSRRRALGTDADRRALFRWYKERTLPGVPEALERISDWLDDGESVALTCFEHRAVDCHRHCVAEAVRRSKYKVKDL